MFEVAPRPLLPPRRFAGRMVAILLTALFVNGVVLAAGAIGYHSLEGLDWLDASLDAALVMTGNGPVHPPHTPEGKLFSLFYCAAWGDLVCRCYCCAPDSALAPGAPRIPQPSSGSWREERGKDRWGGPTSLGIGGRAK